MLAAGSLGGAWGCDGERQGERGKLGVLFSNESGQKRLAEGPTVAEQVRGPCGPLVKRRLAEDAPRAFFFGEREVYFPQFQTVIVFCVSPMTL